MPHPLLSSKPDAGTISPKGNFDSRTWEALIAWALQEAAITETAIAQI